jgi:sulfatase-modifying factor enzyme 1
MSCVDPHAARDAGGEPMVGARIFSLVFFASTVVIAAAPLGVNDAVASPVNPMFTGAARGARADQGQGQKPDEARSTVGSASEAQQPTGPSGACAGDMVEVSGEYCPDIEQPCLRWLPEEPATPKRCAEFAPSSACKASTQKKHFCIDRYEFPNKSGERPIVMKSWQQAADTCKARGKRLCGESEWTLACEGAQRLPYPYGLKRDANACNIDKPRADVDEKALADPRRQRAEVSRLWQGEPSGARAQCSSPYGVMDMTGNVDEWVVNEGGSMTANPFKSGLKGGYWGPVRDRCRPMTTVHGPDFSFYQIGFRCCGDAPGAAAAPGTTKPAPAGPPGKTVPSTNPAPSGTVGS